MDTSVLMHKLMTTFGHIWRDYANGACRGGAAYQWQRCASLSLWHKKWQFEFQADLFRGKIPLYRSVSCRVFAGALIYQNKMPVMSCHIAWLSQP